MDIGTPVIYTDAAANTYAGIIIGHDFTQRNVWRAKADGAIRFNLDGTVANAAAASDDTVAIEKVENHLLIFLGWFRDGSPRTFILSPTDSGLHAGATFAATPVFHPSPAGP
jgi:hypothetical protein